MELNPNHKTAMTVSEHWHTICALLLMKGGSDHVVITTADIAKMAKDICIAVQELPDGLHLRIIGREEGERLARKEGGLPN